LRLRPGDPVIVFDGLDGEWRAELTTVGRRGAAVRLLEHRPLHTEPATHLTLCQALLKGERFCWVLQKGTELGVAEFLPLLAARSVPADRPTNARTRPPRSRAGADLSTVEAPAKPRSARGERWRRIVVEAAEQSGRERVPYVHEPVSLAAALQRPAAKVLCWESETRTPFKTAVDRALAESPQRLDVFIGPEGGFASEEVAVARAAGACVASLGPGTLRSETAAVAAAALVLLRDAV
jgi:16S rRNA (uracil1498-N3)-methyltransferase